MVIEFREARTVSRLVPISQVHRDRLALKDLEVYAWGSESWAGASPLAVLRASDVRTTIDFTPVSTRRLRIRIRDTWRDDHAFPRLEEVEVWAPPPGGAGPAPRRLDDSPVPGEGKSERLLLRRALGERVEFPGEPFDPARGYLGYCRAFLDTMIAEGRDVYGPERSPLFASVLDMESHRIPDEVPACVPGQRQGDRAVRGGNAFHDVMLLRAADLLSDLTGEGKYRAAATDYLRFFLGRRTATGLLPWGEHAHWDFFREAVANPVHEYLGWPPLASWQRMWEIDPAALRAEGDGLLEHVVDLDTFDFDRHAGHREAPARAAAAGRGLHGLPPPRGLLHRPVDLPPRPHRRAALPGVGSADGGPPGAEARPALGPAAVLRPGAGARLGGERAELLGDRPRGRRAPPARRGARPPGAARARVRGRNPGPPAPGGRGRAPRRRPDRREGRRRPGRVHRPYLCAYGGGFTANDAVLLLALHRLTGDPRALALARACAGHYARSEPPPPWEVVRAQVYGSIIGLFSDLYELEGRAGDLAQAERFARLAIERLYHRGLFRGATGIDHYEGSLMVSNLVYGLVRLHTLKARSPVAAPPDTFNR